MVDDHLSERITYKVLQHKNVLCHLKMGSTSINVLSLDVPINNQLKNRIFKWCLILFPNAFAIGYFVWATYHHIMLSERYELITWPPIFETTDLDQNYVNESDKCSRPDPCAPPPKATIKYCPTFCGIEWCNGYGMLLALFTLTYTCLFYYNIVKPLWGVRIHKHILGPLVAFSQACFRHRWSKPIAGGLIVMGILAYVIYDSFDSPSRLQSLSGIAVFIAVGYTFSTNRSKIQYRPVFWGLILQFLLAVFCIRLEVGRNIFRCLGEKVVTFLHYARDGSSFVFGTELVNKDIFFFSIQTMSFFFSLFISIMYYWGAMQWIVQKLGGILVSILGSTVCESVVCASNIFLGNVDTMLLIRPYIKHLTVSEIHLIMASGFATVSGSGLAAYISFGAEPAHLITSSLMAAPAALGFSKLFFPETEVSKTKADNFVLEKSNDTSVLDAASNGAALAIGIVFSILANLIAFVSFVAFLNGAVSFFAHLVGHDDVTFEWIFSKLFIPLAWLMGVPWTDCERVATVIATKTIINEFVAYEKLGTMIQQNLISLRSSAIATYAICGFANPCALGISIATLSALAPEKRPIFTAVAWRAFYSGSIICFITASIAGLLMTDDIIEEIAQ